MNVWIIIACYAILFMASLYLVARNSRQHMVYSLVLLLMLGSVLGALFSILHLKAADELLLTGFTGTVIGAGLLVWRSLRNRQGQLLFYKLMTGLLLIFLIVTFILWPEQSARTALLNYPLTAFIGTVLINEQYEHMGERSILILFLLHGFLYILIDLLKLF